jgi:two-component system sensor histidine kinase PilS (NtrC family)
MSESRNDIVAEVEARRSELNTNLLRVYNYYRACVGAALLAVFLQKFIDTGLGSANPSAFFWVAFAYTAVNALSAVLTPLLPKRLFGRQLTTAIFVLFDFAALSLLMFLSGGVGSGLGALILVSVAAGAILVTGRLSTALAAVATIAVLYEEFYRSLTPPDYTNDYFQAGVLGALYFATAISIRMLSTRLRRSEITSMARAAEVADLERVNRSIIQRMRTGILVVDGADRLRTLNQSARALLGWADLDENDHPLLPPQIQERLTAWRADTRVRSRPFQAAAMLPEVRVNFSAVRPGRTDGDVIVFLEDTTEIQQQAQQLKLAALGRLSASIAHEIRNPLSAIRHAAQLLAESQNLDKGDARLTAIIDSHCQRMNGVIENVLELSRRQMPSPVRLRLLDWLQDFVTQFKQANMDDADIQIDVEPRETEFRVDPGQMAQAMTNLVQNGLRYSQARTGKATLRIEGGIDAATDRPYLNVIDQGPGVPPEQEKHLFEPFFTTERRGTGLGLYITRELCEANQARIAYTRHVDGGSCFRITFSHPERITA